MKAFANVMWAHLGMIQGPPDYESGALTNWAIGPSLFLKKLFIVFTVGYSKVFVRTFISQNKFEAANIIKAD